MTSTESPLLVPLRDLSRQLGSTRSLHVTWEAPPDLGTSQMRVAPGTPLDIDVDLTSVDDGVMVHVRLDVELEGECVRCLDPVRALHEVDVTDVYLEPTQRARGPRGRLEEDAEGEEDVVLTIGEHDTVDLEPLLRDEVVTLADDRPLCREDCAGLCPVCGLRLDDLPRDHHHDVIDPRLAGLQALLGDDDDDEGGR